MKKMYVDLVLSLAKRLPDPLTFTAAELYHRGVISLQEKKQIIKAQSKDKRINELIDVMRYKSDEAFEYLLAIYRDSINRRHDIINPMLEAIRDGKTYREGLPERQPVSHKTVNWPAGTCTSEAAGVSSASDEEYVVVDFFSPSPESQREEAKGGASRGFDIADSFELVNKEEDRAQRSHKLADSDVTVFSGSEGYLGGGSFAEAVRCGTLTKTGEAVAVKIMKILPDQGTRPVIDAKEAKIMGSLSHENVVRFIGYCEHVTLNGNLQLWLVTELVQGGSMRRFCRKFDCQPLSLAERLKVAVQCWNGLAYIHSQHYCHRDIKPENILVTDNLHVKICDFGLSEYREQLKTALTSDITIESGILPSYLYRSPEEVGALQKREVIRSEIYSMGITLGDLYAQRYFWSDHDGNPLQIFQLCAQVLKTPALDTLPVWQHLPQPTQKLTAMAIAWDFKNRPKAGEMKDRTNTELRNVT